MGSERNCAECKYGEEINGRGWCMFHGKAQADVTGECPGNRQQSSDNDTPGDKSWIPLQDETVRTDPGTILHGKGLRKKARTEFAPRTFTLIACVLIVGATAAIVGAALAPWVTRYANPDRLDFVATLVDVEYYRRPPTVMLEFDDGQKLKCRPSEVDGKVLVGETYRIKCYREYKYWTMELIEITSKEEATNEEDLPLPDE